MEKRRGGSSREGAWKPQEAAGGSGMRKAHCGWGAGHETQEIFHKYSSDWIQRISETEETSCKRSDLGPQCILIKPKLIN